MMFEKWYTKGKKLCDRIDFKYLFTKIGIWIFSAVVSLIPAAFSGVEDLPEQGSITVNLSTIGDGILGSTNTIYSLVTLTAMAFSDVLCGLCIDKRKRKGVIVLYSLVQVFLIMVGMQLYALYQKAEVNCENMKNINKVFFLFVFIICLLSYINISTSKRGD
ncbi:MAG: hypothetical protein K2N89_07415 [Lachnospiraceae bacterium]|nr:hypothetical protein [Lachnospiraceae bacterium]